jgi:hypothetical protein
VGSPRLCGRFLTVVARSPIGTANIADPSHRAFIGDRFAQLFVQYLEFWNQMPLSHLPTIQGSSTSISELEEISKILRAACREALAMQPPLPEKISSVFTAASTGRSPDDSLSFGLEELNSMAASIRHELYIAFMVLHITGHADVDMCEDVWLWALRSVCTRRGHPVMQLGAATLTRLAYSAAISVAEDSTGADAPYVQIPSSVVSLLQNASVWGYLLEGLARDRAIKSSSEGGNGGAAQWSSGVDRILRVADYVQQGFPRWLSSIGYQNRSLSLFAFKTQHAGLVMSLLLSIPEDAFNAEFVGAILEQSKTIPSTNEDEDAGNNTLRAELFGGICRIVQSGLESLGPEHRDRLEKISAVLISYLSEQVQSISFAYCKDWADAVIFGFSACPVRLSERDLQSDVSISDFLFQKFGSILAELSVMASQQAEAASADSTSDEGFARHAKYILLFKALLSADLSYASTVHSTDVGLLRGPSASRAMEMDGAPSKLMSYRQHYTPSCDVAATAFRLRHAGAEATDANTSSSVALRTVDALLLSGSAFVSPYRAVRVEMAGVLDLLADAHLDRPTEDIHRLVSRLEDTIKQSGGLLASDEVSAATIAGVEGSKKSSPAHWATELAAYWLENAANRIVFRHSSIYAPLVQVVAIGSASADIELAGICNRTLVTVVGFAYRDCCSANDNAAKWNADTMRGKSSVRVDSGQQPDTLAHVLVRLGVLISTKQSWRIKQICFFAVGIALMNNWSCMDLSERKVIRDIFNAGLLDPKPEIQAFACVGMTVYLRTKSLSEFASLAAAYQKNNDIFAAR